MEDKKPAYKKWISFCAGLLLGLIFLTSGIGKSLDMSTFSGVVIVNTFLPEFLAKMVLI